MKSSSGALAPRRLRAVAIGLAAALVALTGCGPAAEREPEPPVLSEDGTYRVEVLAKDMHFDPDHIAVPAGAHLIIDVENVEGRPHDLVLENGLESGLLPRGKRATIDVGAVDGELDGWCSVDGHRQAGMVLAIASESPA